MEIYDTFNDIKTRTVIIYWPAEVNTSILPT